MRRKPNILFLITDEQRTDSLGCYNSRLSSTPNIDALAASGVIFDDAITPAPLCVPARTSLLSARYPVETGCNSNADEDRGTTDDLLAQFVAAGYRTASFGKHHYRGWAHQHLFELQEDRVLSDAVSYTHFNGLHEPDTYGALNYPSPYTNWLLGGTFPGVEEDTAEADVARRGMEYLENAAEPFFLRLSFNAPHTPVVPPARFLSHIDPAAFDCPDCTEQETSSFPIWLRGVLQEYSRSTRLTGDQITYMRHCYYAQVAYIDHLIGRVLNRLQQTDRLENTIVVFVSDHGTHLGDHCFVQKQTFFDPVVRVPYLIRFPGRLSPGRVAGPVSTISVLPTLMELVGIKPTHDLATRSIVAALDNTEKWEPSEAVFSEYTLESIKMWGLDYPHRLVMVRFGDWKLCFAPDDPEEGQLFDVRRDPEERDNRYQELRESRTVRNLKRQYAAFARRVDEQTE